MTLLPIAEAQARLFAMRPPVEGETVGLGAAAGRWAADDVLARRTQPAATLSAMDGYAIRFADLPGPWRLIGESAAGRAFGGQVSAGECVRIFTGAALPIGTDTVAIQEEISRSAERVTLSGEGPLTLGRNTRRKGLDFSEGDTLIHAGDPFTAARIAVAATAGHGGLPARRRIRVAVAATGDELVAPGSAAEELQLPESNGAMLAAMLRGLPVDIVSLGILPDRLETLTAAFAGVEADILVTTGGASVGDHDLVQPAIVAAGGSIDFWRIALRPGKPMMAGRLGAAIVLGLPGNPVSAYVTALLFVLPLVAHLSGASSPCPQPVTAALGEDLPANAGRTDYLRATLRSGRAHASSIQDSSMLLTLARADCLIVRPAGAPPAHVGDPAEILLLA